MILNGVHPPSLLAPPTASIKGHKEGVMPNMRMTDDLQFTWAQLETVMLSLADRESKRLIVTHLIEATRKQAPFLPVEETIREILCISFALMDQDFTPPDLGPTTPLRV